MRCAFSLTKMIKVVVQTRGKQFTRRANHRCKRFFGWLTQLQMTWTLQVATRNLLPIWSCKSFSLSTKLQAVFTQSSSMRLCPSTLQTWITSSARNRLNQVKLVSTNSRQTSSKWCQIKFHCRNSRDLLQVALFTTWAQFIANQAINKSNNISLKFNNMNWLITIGSRPLTVDKHHHLSTIQSLRCFENVRCKKCAAMESD